MTGDATTRGGVEGVTDSPPAELRASTRLEGVKAWLAVNGPDLVIALSLGVLTAVTVILRLEGIGTGGDAMRKWHFVRQWFHGTSFRDYEWTHHMSRFGIHWITFLVQAIGGRSVNNYYTPGLIAGAVQTVFLYACCKRLGGRAAGVLAAFLLIYFKGAIRASSQLMPEVFSGMYAMIVTYLYLRFAEATGPRTRWLVAMSVAAFVSYLAKETNVFFFPGYVLAILIARGRVRELAIFGGILLAGVLLETAGYSTFTNYAHRLAVVATDHSPVDKDGPKQFMDLFGRFGKLEEFWKFAFYSFLPIGLTVVAYAKDRRVTAVYAITAGYFFLLTFCIAKLDPFAVWLSFRTRYFDAMAPFVQLFAALFVVRVSRELFGGLANKRWARWLQLSPRVGAAAVVVLSLAAGGISYASAAPKLDQHPFVFNKKVSRIAADAFKRNLPIWSVKDNRGAMIFHMVFVNDKVLAPHGELPLFKDIRRTYRGRWWFTKDPDVYDNESFRRMLDEGCVVQVTVKAPKAVSRVNPMEFLPAHCDALIPEKKQAPPPPDPGAGGTETEDAKGGEGGN